MHIYVYVLYIYIYLKKDGWIKSIEINIKKI